MQHVTQKASCLSPTSATSSPGGTVFSLFHDVGDAFGHFGLVVCVATAGLLLAGPAQAVPASLPGLPGITAVNQPTNLPGAGAVLTTSSTVTAHPCARPAAGSVIPQPAQVYSANGALNVHLDYYTDVDANGKPTFCFLYTDSNKVTSQAPTLHAKPGDIFNVEVTNHVAPIYATDPVADALLPTPGFNASTGQCGEAQQLAMDPSSVNVHFHGFLVTPQCQGDNVARTIVSAGDTFQYTFPIPANEPPGLYWFHPHVHGSGEQSVQGGATGTLIIDGIEQFQPSVAGLPARVLVLRDQLVSTDLAASAGGTVPTWDVSVNYVPVTYLATVANPNPAKLYDDAGWIQMTAGQPELWRVANSSADAILDFQVHYVDATGDHVQTVNVVGLDGIPVRSQDGTRTGKPVPMTTISMAPGQRAEFVIAPPGPGVTRAYVQTLNVNTGLIGDTDPVRVIANISTGIAPTGLPVLPAYAAKTWPQRFEGVDIPAVTAKRKLYFYEELLDPAHPQTSATNFYMAVQQKFNEPYLAWGESTPYPYPAEKVLYAPGSAPIITTNVGAVEEWTVENRALEAHVFHIHQIHFKLQQVNGVALAPGDRHFRDDYTIPGWTPPVTLVNGASVPYDPVTGKHFSAMNPTEVQAFLTLYPYPSIKAKFDFRDPVTKGTFVFHCHILAHEDQGMMAAMVVQ